MRPIDESLYYDYKVDCCSFSATFTNLKDAVRLFNERRGRCTIYGNRYDGQQVIIDRKNWDDDN